MAARAGLRRGSPRPLAVAHALAAEVPPVADESPAQGSRAAVARAYAPYAIIIAVFVVCQIAPAKALLDRASSTGRAPT